MRKSLLALLKKDFRLMLKSKFFLLAAGSLLLYTCYINLVWVNIDQEIFPVYLYDPSHSYHPVPSSVTKVDGREQMQAECADGYAVGIDASGGKPKVYMVSCGLARTDRYRAAYAMGALSTHATQPSQVLEPFNKEMKSRREITPEVLFFELVAVGFLGLASMLFQEKQMGVIRVHGVLPMKKDAFILSKLGLILLSDLSFTTLLTLINLGIMTGLAVLPAVLLQAGILSLIMALIGFLCAVALPDFKQFSLLYLALAVFITTPVFLVGQTGVLLSFMDYHPMYHLFMAMKNAYFNRPAGSGAYYLLCLASIILLYGLARRGLSREMAKEG